MTPDQPSQFRDVYRRAGARLPRLLGSWLPVLLTLAVSGCSCWAILALNRAADRTQQAQIALAEIQRNAQNAENLFTKSRPPAPPTLPAGVQPPPPPPGAPGPPGPPPPGGFSAAALQADNLDLLGALHGAVGDRKEVDAVDRELTALNEALRPFAGPGRPPAQYTRGQGIVVRLQSALNRLSQKVTAQRSRATELSNGGTLAIALLSALVVAFMLRRLDQRRRRENERHANELRAQALRDPLTGLANRRQLTDDLAVAFARATPTRPVRLMLFDLDGFKDYNDTFGHHEGDLLLGRLARALGDAVAAFGRAYRLGGDEFCALTSGTEDQGELDSELQRSLSSRGEGFSIRASMGSVLLPTETKNPETAMQLADARMYINKASGRPSAGQQTRNLAMHLLATQEPDVFKHSERVAALAVAVGERLGMSVQALGELARAAELHDIGKVAIPFAVLQKPGPLTEQERELMRRHPIVGANLLSAAPALVGVAAIVRSSHERVDGTGYPDGLAGSEIPLASRIVFACSSFDAMTSDRAYRVGMSTEQAIEELARRAGTQFDPPVIAALEECLRAALPETESDTRTDETLTRKTPAITRPGMRTIPAH